MNSSIKAVVIPECSSCFGEGAVKAFSDKGHRVWGTVRDAQGRNAEGPLEDFRKRMCARLRPVQESLDGHCPLAYAVRKYRLQLDRI